MSRVSRWLWDGVWRAWYPLVTRLSREEGVVFLNYGYSDEEMERVPPELAAVEERNRACVQLYIRVVGGADLRGKEVMEVSCGHGGGAAYVARRFVMGEAGRVVGVDRNARAIALCRGRHKEPGLRFEVGDAMALPAGEGSVDAVVNVEASHCYPDMASFLKEVVRVLRPGGEFLFADFRRGEEGLRLLERQLGESGLEVVERADISAGVVRGMRWNTPGYRAMVERRVPGVLKGAALGFTGVEGSGIFRALESGEAVYVCYRLRKGR